MRLVRLIGNTEGTVGIFVTALNVCISLPEKKFACKILQFLVYINIQDSSVSVLH